MRPVRIFRFPFLIVVLHSISCIFIIFGCQKKPGGEDTSTIQDNLSISALQIHTQYIKAVNSGQQERSDEIPRKYWTDEIKRLSPIKVYMHKTNIVVVQKETANKQEGLYINLIISSYAPRRGDDGFTFTDLGNSVYKFERVIDN